MNEIIYKSNWVLINAYFYSFWMPKHEFNKYKIDKYLLDQYAKLNINEK